MLFILSFFADPCFCTCIGIYYATISLSCFYSRYFLIVSHQSLSLFLSLTHHQIIFYQFQAFALSDLTASMPIPPINFSYCLLFVSILHFYRGVKVVDTTCPWVSKVWNAVDSHRKAGQTR